MPHRFESSRLVETRNRPVLLARLRQSGYSLRPATRDEEWRGIDYIAADADGVRHTLEFKFDEQWVKYGNCFFETTSNDQSGRSGCVLTCQSRWFLYFLVPTRLLVFLTGRLRTALTGDWQHRFPTKPSRNCGYNTLGVCVPVEEAKKVAEVVVHMDTIDMIPLEPELRRAR